MKMAQYDRQMPFVGNQTQFDLMTALNANGRVDSKAAVVRAGLNLLLGLDRDEQIPEGMTAAQVADAALERIVHPERFEVVRKAVPSPEALERAAARYADGAFAPTEPEPVV